MLLGASAALRAGRGGLLPGKLPARPHDVRCFSLAERVAFSQPFCTAGRSEPREDAVSFRRLRFSPWIQPCK